MSIEGTETRVPVPPVELGSTQRPIEIETMNGQTVHGISFQIDGPISGSVVGGVAVVVGDSPEMRSNGGAASPEQIDQIVSDPKKPGPETTEMSGHDVLIWRDTDVVPAGNLEGVEDRVTQRYAIITTTGIVMVTFDGTEPTAAQAYVADVAAAL